MTSHDRRIPELDGVRGLACLMVIVLHVCIAPLPLFPDSWFDLVRFRVQPILSAGVDLFFILSGFLISGALLDSKGRTGFFRNFWARRIARIFPVYYLLIAFSFVLRNVFPENPPAVVHSITNLSINEAIYVFFTQNIYMALNKVSGNNILAVTWSLAIEEQFYLLFPFLAFFLPRVALVFIGIATIIATPFIRGHFVTLLGWQSGYLITFARMDALMLGVLLACFVRSDGAMEWATRWRRPLALAAWTLIALQLLNAWGWLAEVWRLRPGNNAVYLALLCAQFPVLNLAMATLMLTMLVGQDGPFRAVFRSRVLSSIGLVSYGLYMYHQILNYTIWRAIYATNPWQMTWDKAYVPILVLAASGLVAWASFVWFETPARNWLRVRLSVPSMARREGSAEGSAAPRALAAARSLHRGGGAPDRATP